MPDAPHRRAPAAPVPAVTTYDSKEAAAAAGKARAGRDQTAEPYEVRPGYWAYRLTASDRKPAPASKPAPRKGGDK